MPSPPRRLLLLPCFALVVASLTAPLAEPLLERLRQPSSLPAGVAEALDGEEAREGRERERRDARAFDQADLAVQFYVNKRTGPILTRGTAPTTGLRPLSTADYLPALAQMRTMPRYSSGAASAAPGDTGVPDPMATPGGVLTTWANLGPTNQGGRTRALLIDPGAPNVMYAGGVAGGVWKSTDAGATWTPLAQLSMSNLAVVALAFDPATTSTIYAGTGEGVFNIDAVRGAGIFKSTDAGTTWTQLASTNTSAFHYTMSLAISPRSSQRIFAATRSGFYRSINGGASWTTLVSNGSGCTQVVLQPGGVSGYVFVSCGNFSQGTVYRGLDDDSGSFTSVLSLPGQGRSSLALAPSNQSILYVLAAQAGAIGGPGDDGLHGVYRSLTNGDPGSFTTQVDGTTTPATTAAKINQLLLSNPLYGLLAECGFGTSQYLNQGWYDNVIAVDPVDPNRVWAGGIDLWRSDDGGVTWGTAGYWWFSKGTAQYHHADQHGLVFHPDYDGVTNTVLFSTSDGGVDRTSDARAPVNTTLAQICGSPVGGSPTWTDRNNGYVTSQFYHGAVYPDGQSYLGGLQDNGTQRGSVAGTTWSSLNGGDGGYAAVDTLGDGIAGNDVIFLETTDISIRKSVNGGASFAAATSGISDSGLFISPFAMNPGAKTQLWTGGRYIWRTTNHATSWTRASALACGSGSVSAIAAHPLDGNRVLVGMSDGCYHYQTAALTATSTTAWPSGAIAAAYISSLAWDPNDVNVAYATVSRFGTNLYKSTDGGATWTARVGAGGTALPAVPALSVVVNPDDSQQVFVGTDLGVFTSIDGGASWYLENTGFANTPVEALAFNETGPRTLYAFTHGRGAWRVTLAGGASTPSAVNDSYTTPFDTPLTVAAPGVLGNDAANGGGALSAVLDTTTTSGTLVLAVNGGFTFTPVNGFTGSVTFTYHATSGGGSSPVATVTIVVNGAAPTTAPDSYSTGADTPLVVNTPGVLGNDTSNGGGALTAVLQASAAHGTLVLAAGGGFTYTPTSGYSGPDSFTYRAVNAAGDGNVATVALTVTSSGGGVPPPTAVNDAYTTTAGTTLTISAPGVLANDAANGAAAMAAVVVALPAHGSLSLASDGGVIFVPDAGFSGSDGFTYRASSAGGLSAPATVSITVVAPGGPLPPAAFRVSAIRGTLVTLAWTLPTTGPAPSALVLEGGLSPGTTIGSIPLGVVPAVTLSLPRGSFFLRLRANTAAGPSPASNEIAVHVDVPVPPSAPASLLGAVDGSAVSLAWTPSFGGGAPEAARLDVSGTLSGSLPLGAGEMFHYPAMPPGTFTFTVRQVNASGVSTASNPVTLTFPGACSGAPHPPAHLLAFISGGQLNLQWDPPADGPAPHAYLLQVSGGFTGTVPMASRALSVPAPSGTFTFSVVATNTCGASTATPAVTVSNP